LISGSPASDTRAIKAPLTGERLSKLRPLAEDTYSPAIKFLISLTAGGDAGGSVLRATSIMLPSFVRKIQTVAGRNWSLCNFLP
jgi:hypothetical protein